MAIQSPKILYDNYDLYRTGSINSERIIYDNIYPLIQNLTKINSFHVKVLGQSVEGRDINLISLGRGPVKILAWTQMHGDEPTATAAVFDVLKFFAADDELNSVRDEILSGVTLYFIPMLNPDGAEKHQRENILNIDLNRDASRLETPEAQILFNAAKIINPDFAFNLHDQNSYYTAGKVNKTAGISLLAPPFNYGKGLNSARINSMKVIGFLFEVLSEFIPGHIARYNDDFEPRAFGDNFINSGVSSILIESGFLQNDREKSYLRKLNFTALISAFEIIAVKNYERVDTDKYYAIPENESLLFDLLLKNLAIDFNGTTYKIDIGINREKKFDEKSGLFFFKGIIEQIGDLAVNFGIEEYDCSGLTASVPKVDPIKINYDEIKSIDFESLHTREIAFLTLDIPINAGSFINYPVNIFAKTKHYIQELKTGEFANIVLKRNGIPIYIIINGFIKDLVKANKSIHNGLVIY